PASDKPASDTPTTGKGADKAGANASAPKPEAKLATFEQPGHYRATFTSQGAAPEHWVLLNPQYKEDNPKETNKTAQPIDLIRTPAPDLPVTITFPQSGFDLPRDAAWVEQARTS